MKDFVKSFIESNSVSSPTGVGKILFSHDVQRLCDKILEDNGSKSAELKIENDKLKEKVSILESVIKAAESAKPKVKTFIQLHLLSGGVILVRPYDIDSITHTKEGIKAVMSSGKVWDLDDKKTSVSALNDQITDMTY